MAWIRGEQCWFNPYEIRGLVGVSHPKFREPYGEKPAGLVVLGFEAHALFVTVHVKSWSSYIGEICF